MKLKTCEYCGLEFSAELTHCPLCGRAAPTAPEAAAEDGAPSAPKTAPAPHGQGKWLKKKGGKYAAKHAATQTKTGSGNVYSVPKWVMILLCSVLALLVIAGALFALYNIGYFGEPVSMLALFGRTEQTVTQTDATAETAQPETTAPAEETKTPTAADYMNEEDYQQQADEQPAVERAIPCTALSLGSTSVTFEEAEQFYNMTVQLTPADCTQEVVYTSADESIATVNSNGKIVAVSGGATEITVTCGEQSATCLVTCDFTLAAGEQPPAEPPVLNNTDMSFFTPGEQYQLKVLNLEDGTTVTFASSDSSVASVDADGTVTAKGIGTATVTATVALDEPVTLECIVRCRLEDSAESAEPADPNCTISHSDVTMSILGEYFRLSLRDSNDERVSGLTWRSSDTSVCTVDEKGTVYAVGSGTATVSTSYGGTTYECIVRCRIG